MNSAAPAAEAGTSTTTEQVSPNNLPAEFDISKWAADVDEGKEPETAIESQTKPAAPAAGGDQAKTKAEGEKGKKAEGETPKPDAKGGEQPAADKTTPDKPESAYVKAQKEADRRDRSWKQLEQEKTEFRQERAATQATVEGLKRELAQLKAQHAGPARDETGATAETYEGLAKKYADEGNDGMAEAAQARADKLRRQAPAATPEPNAATAEAWRTPEFQTQWKAETEALIAEAPELADPNHAITKAANALLADKTWAAHFLARPNGIRAAVEVARLLEKSATIDATKEELKTAKAEIERLNKLTQIRGSLPGGPKSGPRKLEDMSSEEAHNEVRRLAEAADRGEI